MSTLKVNQSQKVTIKASKYWNRTNIYLEATGTYLFEAQGQQIWYDGWIKSDADGFTKQWLHWAEILRRSASEKWFALIGSINQITTDNFLIGKKTEYKSTVSGDLMCYVNDVPFMYFNNRGQILLTITRLS